MNIVYRDRSYVTNEEVDAMHKLQLECGLMSGWYFRFDEPMNMMFLYHNNKIIGWAGFLWFDINKKVSGRIGVFVSKRYRKKGYGKLLFTCLLYEIHDKLNKKYIRIEKRISHWVKPYSIKMMYF